MRPCPVERIEQAPAYVLGVGLIRGEMVPVVDASVLLAGDGGQCRRFVVLRAGERRVALAVAEVVGARMLDRAELDGLPPLLAGRAELVAQLGVLDGKFLEVLESTRLFELVREPVAAGRAS
jgi:purine-binding chemotaxis protein CheW